FDSFFKGLWIGDHPTSERNSYLVLPFNFSAVRADVEYVEQSFEDYGTGALNSFLRIYEPFFTENALQELRQTSGFSSRLSQLLRFCRELNLPLYILIDEYDNFANTILTTAGEKAYHDITHGEGFFRHFFTVLKEGTSHSGSGLKRLFITGVSPVTMDDVTSGFNIGKNLSLSPALNEMVGFTREEVLEMLEYYRKEGVFLQNMEETLALFDEWYNGYKFSNDQESTIYNTDMVIYYVCDCIQIGQPPH
ncbi:MAG: AAA family ATPase, partial [SAR324 cluster bacterium]|nr:AAA family ATPase [SAR324 cluster bacterium]